MERKEYPKITIIMRGLSLIAVDKIVNVLQDYDNKFAVEVTLNSDDALNTIRYLTKKYSNKVMIGAGTVRTLDNVREAINSGAQFLLSPTMFTKEMVDYSKQHNIITVAGAFSPTEISSQFDLGVDIVKVFPANVLGPKYFSDIQAPLGRLRLMAVGGISKNNYKDYFAHNCDFVGIGSAMFAGLDLDSASNEDIKKVLDEYL